jgi:hypothetical protein
MIYIFRWLVGGGGVRPLLPVGVSVLSCIDYKHFGGIHFHIYIAMYYGHVLSIIVTFPVRS